MPFFLGGGGEGGGGEGLIPRLSVTSQVGEEVRLSRRKQYRADTVGITHGTKKPSNDVPSTRIRLFLKQQLHELSADSLVSCERKALKMRFQKYPDSCGGSLVQERLKVTKGNFNNTRIKEHA